MVSDPFQVSFRCRSVGIRRRVLPKIAKEKQGNDFDSGKAYWGQSDGSTLTCGFPRSRDAVLTSVRIESYSLRIWSRYKQRSDSVLYSENETNYTKIL
ncbi:uncharacterized protein LOC122501816 isoform X2 [Leptopilina heterotoma]|uniref:uncharacterized protein LOC122501816 isoform X2 n=1 Tax=Leptopilina heterotoma TaxID=63436 RepID=UPI001CA8D3E9|nr:uncharacterized protein LOC122501816 isoform X2 [Leptopilina heterotoma]